MFTSRVYVNKTTNTLLYITESDAAIFVNIFWILIQNKDLDLSKPVPRNSSQSGPVCDIMKNMMANGISTYNP